MNPSSRVADAISYVRDVRKIGFDMKLLSARANEFEHPLQMQLAGIASNPEARSAYLQRLDCWPSLAEAVQPGAQSMAREVVIGSGYHAAVYCAARVLSGFERPLVLERGQVGGVFAMTEQPVFWLNSRNRPGEPGFPRTGRALNYLPGAPIQASSLGMGEFQSNADMAFVIQTALAQYANVYRGAEVATVTQINGRSGYRVKMRGTDQQLLAGRVIDARGLGQANNLPFCNNANILSYEQFMVRMAQPFPLKGMRRVAVIGSGDSSRCAVESLLGLAPPPRLGLGDLDYVEEIDWYGRELPSNCDSWRRNERGRYLAIGSSIKNERAGRLKIRNSRASFARSMGAVIVNDRPYDLAVVATGYEGYVPFFGDATSSVYNVGGSMVARRSGVGLFAVGPAAGLPFSAVEIDDGIALIQANETAMFRLGWRTAVLGCNLAQPPVANSI